MTTISDVSGTMINLCKCEWQPICYPQGPLGAGGTNDNSQAELSKVSGQQTGAKMAGQRVTWPHL